MYRLVHTVQILYTNKILVYSLGIKDQYSPVIVIHPHEEVQEARRRSRRVKVAGESKLLLVPGEPLLVSDEWLLPTDK